MIQDSNRPLQGLVCQWTPRIVRALPSVFLVPIAFCLMQSTDLSLTHAADDQPAVATRPKLQFINASDEIVEIYWIPIGDDPVSNGTIPPGEQRIIQTTIGHEFEVRRADGMVVREVVCEVAVQALRIDMNDPDGIPEFYTKRITANGFPIVASPEVNDYALSEAAYLVDMMLAQRADVRDAMIKSGSRLCIIAHNEFTTDQPEWKWMANQSAKKGGVSAKDFWDARARGMGGSDRDPFCSCGEENLLAYPGDPYQAECILIHELAHNIHLRGMANVDPTFDRRLREAYQRAMAKGLWAKKYASVNHHEYFAEGVQSWFDNNRSNDHDHNHVDTRVELVEYDPGLAAICEEVFGDTKLSYTKPVTRLSGHLKGYDPQGSPKFRWPKRLELARKVIRESAASRR